MAAPTGNGCFVGAKILFDIRGTFVVHEVHGWAESVCSEVGVEFGGGHELFAFRFVFYRLRQDGVGIVVVQDHDVFATFAGGMRETSGLVAVHFAGDVDRLDSIRAVGPDLLKEGRSSFAEWVGWTCVGW